MMLKRSCLIILSFFLLIIATTVDASKRCDKCHSQDRTIKNGATIVDKDVLAQSIHADLECLDCHVVNPNKNHKGNHELLCVKCHIEEAEKYAQSPHMEGREISLEEVPGCASCHGGHDILAKDDPNSKINHINSIAICTSCHEDEHIRDNFEILPEPQMIIAYEHSVHGYALLMKGNMEAPACVDCHGSHSFLPSDRVDSPIDKGHIAQTCGRCHADIAEQYTQSVHGVALKAGVLESPTCTDCHGEHNIKAHLDPESKIFAANIPTTCSACHSSEKVVGRFGLKAERIETFSKSFHGTAIEFGETNVANCASCHGVHDIYPQSNPKSLIHRDNIQSTCGKCHEDLPADFAKGTVHTSPEDEESGGPFYVRKFYYIFIPALIILFILYRVLEYKRRVK